MKKYKQFLIGFLVGAMLFSSIGVFAEGLTLLLNPFPILVNGIKAEIEAYNINGRTFMALGDVAKYFGATAKLNEVTKEIEVTTNTTSLEGVSLMSTATAIEYDLVTGLPIGAEYVDNMKDGRSYKTINYNGKIYISESGLKKYGIVYVTKGTFINRSTGETVTVNLRTDTFSVQAVMYTDLSLFSELIGENHSPINISPPFNHRLLCQ